MFLTTYAFCEKQGYFKKSSFGDLILGVGKLYILGFSSVLHLFLYWGQAKNVYIFKWLEKWKCMTLKL